MMGYDDTWVWLHWNARRLEYFSSNMICRELDHEILNKLGVQYPEHDPALNGMYYLSPEETNWLDQSDARVINSEETAGMIGLQFENEEQATAFSLTWMGNDNGQ